MEDHICLGVGCKECLVLGINNGKKSRLKKTTKTLKNNSKNQERAIAKDYVKAGFEKARRVPGSGAFANLPADVDPGELLLLEAKMTRTGRMIIDPEWLSKTERQAKEMGRPFYALHTWVADESHPFEKWVTIREDYFFELLRRLNAAERELAGDSHEMPSRGVS